MRFGDLTYREIREKAAASWLAVVPTGCTEQQGPHLPVDFDTWFAETLLVAAAKHAADGDGIQTLVLPALPFGPTPEHRGFGSGYIDVPVDVHTALVRAILESLVAQGFRRLVVWRGCGGHDLQATIADFNAAHRWQARAVLPDAPYHAVWCRIGNPTVPGGHADSFTTSLALYLRPAAVRVDQIVNPGHRPVDWTAAPLDFAQYSATGVIGDPTHATAELGERLWAELVPTVANLLRAVAGAPLDG